MHNPSHFLHNRNLDFLSSWSSIRDRERHAEAARFAKMAPTYRLHKKIDYAKFMQSDYAKFMQKEYAKFMQDYAK
jgi:hypothetical protein